MKILHLEDRATDAELAESFLRSAWPDITITVVSTRSAFIAELDHGGYLIILADFTLPAFSGLEALELTRARSDDLPFVFLTGTLDEDLAIDALEVSRTVFTYRSVLMRGARRIFAALRRLAILSPAAAVAFPAIGARALPFTAVTAVTAVPTMAEEVHPEECHGEQDPQPVLP